MRGIALAVVLAALIVAQAIRKRTYDDLTAKAKIICWWHLVITIVCIAMGW